MDLDVDEKMSFLVGSSTIYQTVVYVLNMWVDPDNLINETYSNKDGSF